MWQIVPNGYTLDSPLARAARPEHRRAESSRGTGQEPAAYERAPDGLLQVFLISLAGLRALLFWTQNSASLDPQNVVPHCGAGQTAQIGYARRVAANES